MLFDKQTLFSDQQTLVLGLGVSAFSTNTIDLGALGTPALGTTQPNDIGRGEPVDLLVQVTETVTSGGAATLEAQLVQADSADLATNTEVIATSGPVALAKLVAGYQFRIPSVPPGVSKRYLGMRYVNATAATTAGKVTAGVVLDRQTNPAV